MNISKPITIEKDDTALDQYTSISQFINDGFKRYSDRIFVRYCSEETYKTLTYSDVDRISSYLAYRWSDTIDRTQVVSFLCDHGVDYLIMLMAILKLGAPFFAISPRNSEAAVISLMEKTGSRLLLVSSKYKNLAATVYNQLNQGQVHVFMPLDLVATLNESMDMNDHDLFNHKCSSNDDKTRIVFILHSSGSTNFPKPIYCTNDYMFNVINTFHAVKKNCSKMDQITKEDTFLACAPLFHSFGLTCAFQMLTVGGSIVFMERLPPSQEEIKFALDSNPCTLMSAPPLILEQMIHWITDDVHYRFLLSRLKYVFFGGASLQFETGERFHEQGINVRMTYGLSEAGTMMISDPDRNSKNWYSLAPITRNGAADCLFEQDEDALHMYIDANSSCLSKGVSNRPDGGYSTNDLFRENPLFPGYYIYLGRLDDILIMKNGEKTNPTPMEHAIMKCPLVKHVSVLGHGRQCTAVLIEMDSDYIQEQDHEDAMHTIHEAVKEANKECPSHSVILDPMIKILPKDKTLPTNAKGLVSRKLTEEIYKEMIEDIYKTFLEGPTKATENEEEDTWVTSKVEDFLVSCAAEILDCPMSLLYNCSSSLFDYGLNSLSCIQLRNRIAQRFNHISLDFVYQHSNIVSMTEAILKNQKTDASFEMEQQYDKTQRLAESYLKRAEADFPMATYTGSYKREGLCVLLTGATGSLGSFILLELLKNEKIKKVYCMVRGEESPRQRLEQAFASRFLDVALLKTGRVDVLPFRLNEAYLGLSKERYYQLREEIDLVQHCAWMLDFNRNIEDYDTSCISPLYNLVKFACRETNPMHFHFISSISASAMFGNPIEEKPLPLNSRVAMPKGYAQSKFVVEVLLNYLVDKRGFPCYIERLGQVCGDTKYGTWNISEQYPLMIVGGTLLMRKMPALENMIDWIPVDCAAAAVVDIMIYAIHTEICSDNSIYHITNPGAVSWSEVLNVMKSCGMVFEIVSPKDWIEALGNDMQNPAYRLLSFYKNSFSGTFKMPTLQIEKTRKITRALDASPVIDAVLFSKLLSYWRKVGFYQVIR
ncbi:unnamed protein product [Rhizopus stolonifer]